MKAQPQSQLVFAGTPLGRVGDDLALGHFLQDHQPDLGLLRVGHQLGALAVRQLAAQRQTDAAVGRQVGVERAER